MEKSILQTLRFITAFGYLWLGYENLIDIPIAAVVCMLIGIFCAWKYNSEILKKEV